jgi:hypothetical protein
VERCLGEADLWMGSGDVSWELAATTQSGHTGCVCGMTKRVPVEGVYGETSGRGPRTIWADGGQGMAM